MPAKLKKQYKADEYNLYARLAKLFGVIDVGDNSLNVPIYNGGLFLTAPDPDDSTAEAFNARFLIGQQVPDFHLAMALDLMARVVDDKRHDLVFVDYKSLGVRQLGSIYEGLLEFKLRIADRKLGFKKKKGVEVYVPFTELTDRQKNTAERQKKVVRKGSVYLENDKRQRKATGSYYTPGHIVKYIVENAVGPVAEQKFEALRPKLRKAQQDRRAFEKRQEALEKQGLKREPESKIDLIGQELVDEIFDVKVLDPAMGSGHFLVEAVDFITDRTLHFLNAFPWNPVLVFLEKIRNTIQDEMDGQGITIDYKRLTDVNLLKRYVLKRCIYGVDLNPMAVELAKVSLWLDCFTLGAPLSFLDHHLRCGNSLIGVTVEEVKKALEGPMDSLFDTSKFAGLQLAVNMMQQVGRLSDVTSAQVRESRQKYGQAVDALIPFKRILDVYTSQWFGNTEGRVLSLLRAKAAEPLFNATGVAEQKAAISSITQNERKIAQIAFSASDGINFFHWEIEFPEVFFSRPKESKASAKPGFDVVVGNPPYVRQEGLSDYKQFIKYHFDEVYHGQADIYVYFIFVGIILLNKYGVFSLITSNKYMNAAYGNKLRSYLSTRNIVSIVDFKDLPIFADATAYPSIIVIKGNNHEGLKNINIWQPNDMASANKINDIFLHESSRLNAQQLGKQPWVLNNSNLYNLIEKLKLLGQPLFSFVGNNFYRGVTTGCNEAFVINQDTYNDLIDDDPKNHEIIRPYLRGKDIKKWAVNWHGLYLIFPRRGVDINSYQSIKKYLSHYKNKLTPGVPGGRKPGNYKWFEIQDTTNYYMEFEKPKIVWPDISKACNFAFDDGRHYLGNTCYILPTNDLFLLGVLNSKLVMFYLLNTTSKIRGGYLRFIATYISSIPIKLPRKPDKDKLTQLSGEMICASSNSRVIEIQQEIDDIIFKVYGLTSQEISLITNQHEMLK